MSPSSRLNLALLLAALPSVGGVHAQATGGAARKLPLATFTGPQLQPDFSVEDGSPAVATIRAHILVALGANQLAAQDYAGAAQTYDKALAEVTDFVPALVGKALALSGSGDADGAEQAARYAVEKGAPIIHFDAVAELPEDAAQVLQIPEDEWAEALSFLEAGDNAKLACLWCVWKAESVVAGGQGDPAPWADKALKLDDQSAPAMTAAAYALRAQGKVKEAVAMLKRARAARGGRTRLANVIRQWKVDVDPPQVKFIKPVDGDNLRWKRIVEFIVEVRDNSKAGVKSVKAFINRKPMLRPEILDPKAGRLRFNWDTGANPYYINKANTFRVVATDAAGNVAEAEIGVRVRMH